MSSYRDYYFSLKKNNKYNFTDTIIYSLFYDVSGLDESHLLIHFDDEINDKEKLDKYISRIESGDPYQYVLGYTYFLGNKFYVNKDVLIPRQETEQLVLNTIQLIKENFDHKVNVLDMCSGSGCIGISIAKNIDAEVDMVDISENANKVAHKNNILNKTNCRIYKSDMFNDIPVRKYDVIISNPPYIKDESSVDFHTMMNEPHLALFASPQTKFYEEIMAKCIDFLAKTGILTFEIEEDMEDGLTELVNKYLPGSLYFFQKDIYNKTRFLYIIRK